jgi:hypothetical protein
VGPLAPECQIMSYKYKNMCYEHILYLGLRPVDPIIENGNVFQPPKQSNPWSKYPHDMVLHAYKEVINNRHRHVTSEGLKFYAHIAQGPRCIITETRLPSTSLVISRDIS